MRYVVILATLCATLLLTACAGSAPQAAPLDPSSIDVSSLPVDIDVQTAAALKQRPDVVVLDVREQWEYDEGHIPGVVHMPMEQVPQRLAEIPSDKTVLVSCQSGRRSAEVTGFLQQQGFKNVHNLAGGFAGWQRAGLPVER